MSPQGFFSFFSEYFRDAWDPGKIWGKGQPAVVRWGRKTLQVFFYWKLCLIVSFALMEKECPFVSNLISFLYFFPILWLLSFFSKITSFSPFCCDFVGSPCRRVSCIRFFWSFHVSTSWAEPLIFSSSFTKCSLPDGFFSERRMLSLFAGDRLTRNVPLEIKLPWEALRMFWKDVYTLMSGVVESFGISNIYYLPLLRGQAEYFIPKAKSKNLFAVGVTHYIYIIRCRVDFRKHELSH